MKNQKLVFWLIFAIGAGCLGLFPWTTGTNGLVMGASPWKQVNPDGFGDSQNGQIPSLVVFDGYLYAGTQNYAHHPESAEIWRTPDGENWSIVDNRLVNGAAAMIVYKDYIYGGCWGSPGKIWRSQNGTSWTEVITDGFNDANNGIARFAVFNQTLFASTWNGTTGTEIWRTTNGVEWEQFGSDGINTNPNNGGAISSQEFNGYLYWGIGNWTTGAQLWRTNGLTWTPVVTDGFGSAANAAVSSLAVFDGYLYAGLWNPESVQIWRSSNGMNWTNVVDGSIGGDEAKMESALEAYNGWLYFVIDNEANGLEVWRTFDGLFWEQIGFTGFGDIHNVTTYWDNATTVFDGKLYIAAKNTATGGEIWQLAQPVSQGVRKLYLPFLRK